MLDQLDSRPPTHSIQNIYCLLFYELYINVIMRGLCWLASLLASPTLPTLPAFAIRFVLICLRTLGSAKNHNRFPFNHFLTPGRKTPGVAYPIVPRSVLTIY